jgi:hypothetical protein
MTSTIVVGGRWKSALLCALLTAIAQTATAQEVAGSFEQLQVLVKPGDTVTVRDASGVETKGTIAALSSSTLALLAADTRLELSENDVSAIKQRRSDSLANGALIGLAIGAGASAALMIAVGAEEGEEMEVGFALMAIGIYGAIGTGIGVGIDALIKKEHVIFRRQPTTELQVGIAPWLTTQRKGVLVTLRF